VAGAGARLGTGFDYLPTFICGFTYRPLFADKIYKYMTETYRRKDTVNRHLLHHANGLCLIWQRAIICIINQLMYITV